jgi:hypothetical protein
MRGPSRPRTCVVRCAMKVVVGVVWVGALRAGARALCVGVALLHCACQGLLLQHLAGEGSRKADSWVAVGCAAATTIHESALRKPPPQSGAATTLWPPCCAAAASRCMRALWQPAPRAGRASQWHGRNLSKSRGLAASAVEARRQGRKRDVFRSRRATDLPTPGGSFRPVHASFSQLLHNHNALTSCLRAPRRTLLLRQLRQRPRP